MDRDDTATAIRPEKDFIPSQNVRGRLWYPVTPRCQELGHRSCVVCRLTREGELGADQTHARAKRASHRPLIGPKYYVRRRVSGMNSGGTERYSNDDTLILDREMRRINSRLDQPPLLANVVRLRRSVGNTSTANSCDGRSTKPPQRSTSILSDNERRLRVRIDPPLAEMCRRRRRRARTVPAERISASASGSAERVKIAGPRDHARIELDTIAAGHCRSESVFAC